MEANEIFLNDLSAFYGAHRRDLPWRVPESDGSFDVYKILVSEIMLQQTQVKRVIPKYLEFLAAFPTMQALAAAPLPAILAKWSGLGYNRRAKYLHQTAKRLANKVRPPAYGELVECPGIGPNTAAAILAYTCDEPVVFVETNIRTVMIHHFFADYTEVSDKEILGKLHELTPEAFQELSPREFYWAMMDYGTFLKSTVGNLSRQSKAYAKQSKFAGSTRQIRGQVVRLLLDGPLTLGKLKEQITDDRLPAVIKQLEAEKLVTFRGSTLMLYNEIIKTINS